ncbi:hypothetical protein [Rhodovibrio salinarum]|uniref:Uncharacterized protein n=1 Tax=Rhodovibrio salinarum TaxID=1087 RepID=A0A934V175_9PROT|nr:hypothetical protein [Rhodovibrio salinarum]MBK1698518.1 hypothetical protein [Rhodovibrio salinarum]
MTSTAFENRETADLSSGGMFALWCLRKRVYCLKQGEDPQENLGHGFELAGIRSAMRDFEVLFKWLAQNATRPIQLGDLKCGRVSPDEGLLLAALAAFQRQDAASGRLLLGCFMPRVACLHAAPTAAKFASALTQAELPIDLVEPQACVTERRHPEDRRAAPSAAVPSSVLVH